MNRSMGGIRQIALTTVSALGLILASGSLLVDCGSNNTTPQDTSALTPPPPPTPIYTPTPSANGYTPSLNNVFDGVAGQAQNCLPNFLYYQQAQNTYGSYPGSYGFSNANSYAFGSSQNSPSPAVNFFNDNINNGYYQPAQPQYNYYPAASNGFYPSNQGWGCMNTLGSGTAAIGQISAYYYPPDIKNYVAQLMLYLYFSSTLQGPPQIINVNATGAGGGNTAFIYYPTYTN